MPNHVSNLVKMKGIGELPLFSMDEEGNEYLDFDKIVPMPKSLNLTSGSVTDENIVFFITDRCETLIEKLDNGKSILLQMLVHNSFDGNWVQTVFDRVSEEIKTKTEEELNKMYDMGNQYVSNFLNYGATDWYEWRCENWGTKWNSYEFYREDNDTISFWTAWSCPEPIIKKLAEMYPGVEIEHYWADEAGDFNAGHVIYKDGEIIGGYAESEEDAQEYFDYCW